MKQIFKYAIIRLLLTIPMVFILLTLVFVVLRIMPGDPVKALLGAHTPPYVIEEKRESLGLNKPIPIQYIDYLSKVIRLDFGNSLKNNREIITIISEKLPATIELTVFGMFFTLLIGIPLGAIAANRRKKASDFSIRLFGIVVYCIPVYWMGLMLQLIFGVWLNWLPIAGRTDARTGISAIENTGFYIIDTLASGNFSAFVDVLKHLILPSITLGVVLSGIFIRLTRANMLDILKSDYILSARARGIPEGKVVYGHGLKNALIPILTMLGLQFALLLAGAILTETTFSWPGMGRLLLDGIYDRDYNLIQGVIIIFAIFISFISLVIDILYALIDPRVRY